MQRIKNLIFQRLEMEEPKNEATIRVQQICNGSGATLFTSY